MTGKVAPRRVALVGLGPSRVEYIDAADRAGDRFKLFDETWTFNSFVNTIESDRLFHMDDVLVQELRAANGNTRVAGMLVAMKRYKGPIYTSFAESEYPTAVDYPLHDVVKKYHSLYFTTTPPYAVAYAGLIGVRELHVFGCDYTWPGMAEAEGGRACMEYWLGRVQGEGMRVVVSPNTSLLDARVSRFSSVKLYGYDRVAISMEDRGGGKLALIMEEKALPTVAEIEERYSHRKPGSSVALDVVN